MTPNTARGGIIPPKPSTTGVGMIIAERQRQTMVKGWTAEHDDSHSEGELIDAAIAYAMISHTPVHWASETWWPWSDGWKPSSDAVRNLVKAGALIAAEIDRITRADAAEIGRTS